MLREGAPVWVTKHGPWVAHWSCASEGGKSSWGMHMGPQAAPVLQSYQCWVLTGVLSPAGWGVWGRRMDRLYWLLTWIWAMLGG